MCRMQCSIRPSQGHRHSGRARALEGVLLHRDRVVVTGIVARSTHTRIYLRLNYWSHANCGTPMQATPESVCGQSTN